MLKTTLAKLLTVKVAALCAAAAGAGGVALAAQTGALPNPLHHPTASVSAHAGMSAAGKARGADADDSSARPSHSAPPAGLVALCRAYLGKDNEHRGKALQDPAFRDLVTEAHSQLSEDVNSFCAQYAPGHLKDASESPAPVGRPTDLPIPTLPGLRPSDLLKPTK